MFSFDIRKIPEPFKFYLCRPSGEVLYELNGIDESTATLTLNLNNQYELSFDYDRFIGYNGERIESNGYHNILVGMKILVDKIGYFVLKYPPYKYDGEKEYKTITAYSVECELEDKDLVGFKINTGKEDSLENLVTYEEGETESLLNAYTGLPYDYIVFHNTYSKQLEKIKDKYSDGIITDTESIKKISDYCKLIPRLKSKVNTLPDKTTQAIEYVKFNYNEDKIISNIELIGFNNRVKELISFYSKYGKQLSLIELALEKCEGSWTVGEIDESLVNKRFQFDVNENIYSFLTTTVAQTARCVFSFDLFKKKVNVILAENLGRDTGVIIDKSNLLNSVEINSNSDSLYTRFDVTGDDKLNISFVNFGDNRISDLSYFMNARDNYGQRGYVSDELTEKYSLYLKDIEVARDKYIELTKQYNSLLVDMDILKYKLPNDGLNNNWDSFNDEELEKHLMQYEKQLVTLISLYKEDYRPMGVNSDDSVKEEYLKNTEYWHDYFAYKNIIEQIKATITERTKGGRYSNISNKELIKKIKAYKTEWSLYGISELEHKVAAYNNGIKVLIDKESILLNPDKSAKKWSELTLDQKKEYGNLESNYQYEPYMNLFNERSSCQSYLNTLRIKLEELENSLKTVKFNRNKLVRLVRIKGYDRIKLAKIITLPSPETDNNFTKEEVSVLSLFYLDKSYNNPNILKTNLDTLVSEVDIQKELLEDAKEQLSIESQPQVFFNAEIDNLLCMNEFEDYDFSVGNYVVLQYFDNYYIRLRLSSLTFNPCIPQDNLTVLFTNYVKSATKRSDLSHILGMASGTKGSSSNGSVGGSGDEIFGKINGLDISLSNTMLAKLLNTELFGTRVNNIILDTVKVNEITAKYAKFDGLAKGTTIIDGKCITTGYIVDNLYDGLNGNIANANGSVINLETGKFNFGGGRLKFDGTELTLKGAIKAEAGYIGGENGFTITSGKIYSNGHNLFNSANEGVYIGTDYISLGNSGKTYFKKDGTFSLGSGGIVFDGNKVRLADNISISWSALPSDVPNRNDVTTITRDTISTAHIYAQNLEVNAARINGTIQAHQIDAYNLNVNAANIYGKLIASRIDTSEIEINAARIRGTLKASVLSSENSWLPYIYTRSVTSDYIHVGNLFISGNNVVSEFSTIRGALRSLEIRVSRLEDTVAKLVLKK